MREMAFPRAKNWKFSGEARPHTSLAWAVFDAQNSSFVCTATKSLATPLVTSLFLLIYNFMPNSASVTIFFWLRAWIQHIIQGQAMQSQSRS